MQAAAGDGDWRRWLATAARQWVVSWRVSLPLLCTFFLVRSRVALRLSPGNLSATVRCSARSFFPGLFSLPFELPFPPRTAPLKCPPEKISQKIVENLQRVIGKFSPPRRSSTCLFLFYFSTCDLLVKVDGCLSFLEVTADDPSWIFH
ncbi:hypothetical protein Droror1_Dr00006410 [Drosera rotundifolia]